MEIEENVNPGTGKRQFSKIPFGNRKNMQSQIVVCEQTSSLLGQVSRILHVDKTCKHKNARHVLPMSLEQGSLFSCVFQNVKTSRQKNCEHRGP